MVRQIFASRTAVVMILMAVFVTGFTAAEESVTSYYSFPFSVGAGYVPLGPVAELGGTFSITEIAGSARLPLPGMPALRPLLRFGLTRFDSQEAAELAVAGGVLDDGVSMPDYDPRAVWDHSHLFAGLGVEYALRLSKEFEVGAEASGGASLSYFPNRFITSAGEPYTVGAWNLYASVSGKISLNPSFNISVDITPSFRYLLGLGDFRAFDGLLFGIGFAGHYRFGRDPDSPEAQVRALRISQVKMPPVFAAMQSYYPRNPLAQVEITNTQQEPVTDLQLDFHQAGLMDSATPCAQVPELGPGESVSLPLLAGFNGDVFKLEGITPLTGELVTTYTYRGRPVTQSEPVTYDLYDKSSLTWDDDRKVAAFITPSDSAVRNYASFIRTRSRDEVNPYMPPELQFGMQAFHALGSLGILYQMDPTSPFTDVQGNSLVVDSINLPRETLARITGDCDDLTVLYDTLLESVSVQSAFVTVPGHIFSAFNTTVPAAEHARVHPDRDMLIVVDGEIWVPVEITMIGRGSFLDAWRVAMEEWNAAQATPGSYSFIRTSDAQQVYRPVGLVQSDMGLQYGEPEAFLKGVRTDVNTLAGLMLDPARSQAVQSNTPRAWNAYGVAAARLGQYSSAEDAFSRAVTVDPSYYAAQINMGSLRFIQERYQDALASFLRAERSVSGGSRVSPATVGSLSINLSRTYYALGSADEARAWYDKATAIQPELAGQFAFLAAAPGSEATGSAGADNGSGGDVASAGRAAEVPAGEVILFIEDE